MTVGGLVAEAAAELRRHGVATPELDAERLLRHALGWDRATILASAGAAVGAEPAQRFRRLVAERGSRVPLQHLIGSQAFWRHEFRVTREVLIPRPETELLVETALELAKGSAKPLLVDVGTGSGCIALSLAAERPDAELHATDVSAPALEVARDNARRLGLERRVSFHLGDLLEPVSTLAGRVDLVISNPPYVDAAERDSLEPEVRDHEPGLALFPPGDALAIYRRLLPAALESLRPGGSLLVEIAPALERPVAALFEGVGFEELLTRRDLAGRSRMLQGRRPARPRLG